VKKKDKQQGAEISARKKEKVRNGIKKEETRK